MSIGELACKILGRVAELNGLGELKVTETLICQEFTDEAYDQEFYDLLRGFRSLGITEMYNFSRRDKVWDCIQLSKKGKELVDAIKDDEMQKYFIVAITIYCNQRKFTPNELAELLSKTDSFKSKDEVEEILENFRKMFAIEENYVKIGRDWKRTIRIKDCVFGIFIIEEPKYNII